jgi:hypothetical protein
MAAEYAEPLVRSRWGALDPLGWMLLAAGTVALALAGIEAVAIFTGGSSVGTVVLFATWGWFFVYVARQTSEPEVDTRCRECQQRVYVDSARGDRSCGVAVELAGQPTRLSLGPLSVVRRRNRERYWYCSPVCARGDLGPLKDLDDDGVLEPADDEAAAGRLEVAA